jgi:nitrite reductase/ring-hydroxylating ferredoxin subunit
MNWKNLFQRKIRLITELPAQVEQNRFYPVSTSKGQMLAVFAKEGWVFFVNRCPHAGGTFAEHLGNESEVVCSLHRFRYSLQTGQGATGQGDFLRIYQLIGTDELVEKGV